MIPLRRQKVQGWGSELLLVVVRTRERHPPACWEFVRCQTPSSPRQWQAQCSETLGSFQQLNVSWLAASLPNYSSSNSVSEPYNSSAPVVTTMLPDGNSLDRNAWPPAI